MRESWTYKRLKDIGVVITGNTPSTKDSKNYSSNDYCFVKPSDIAKEGVSIITDSEFHISQQGYESSRKLPKGSVLTTCIGIIGKVGILDIDATCNQQINAIIPSSTILPKFLALAILSVRSQLETMANAPVVPIINKGDFSNVVIPIPPIEEQERIVAELDLLSGIIDKQKAQLQELDTLAQSIFYDMFGEVDINNKLWDSVEIGDVFYSIKNGANIKQTKGAKGLPITRIETLSGGVFNRNRLGYADIFDAQKYSKYVLDDGDILMSHINSKVYIGRSVVYKKEDGEIIIHGMNLLRLKPISSILNSVYAKFLFDTFFFKKQVASIRKDAVNQSSIAVGDIVKLIMRLPPIEIQDTFAQKIQSIESQKASINQSIAETQKLFDSAMDKYFG